MPRNPRRILVIKLRATGDVVLATPVIENLKRRYPRARLSFLTEEASADVLRWHPMLDELIVLPLRRWGSQGILGTWREQARFYRNLRRKRFDLAIDLFGNPRSALLTWLSGAAESGGFRLPAAPPRLHHGGHALQSRPQHEVLFHLEALEALDIPVAADRPRVAIPGTADRKAGEWLREHVTGARAVIALNPGGGWAIKRWPPEFFGRLADALIDEYGVAALILWGPGEEELVARVTGAMRNRPLVLPVATLAELGAFLKRCGLLVSNDSAPMHMAAAMNVPTVGIFGPTDPRAQGPWGDGHGVVRKESVDCLGCNRIKCPIGNICMTTLEPGELLEQIRAYIPVGIVET